MRPRNLRARQSSGSTAAAPTLPTASHGSSATSLTATLPGVLSPTVPLSTLAPSTTSPATTTQASLSITPVETSSTGTPTTSPTQETTPSPTQATSTQPAPSSPPYSSPSSIPPSTPSSSPVTSSSAPFSTQSPSSTSSSLQIPTTITTSFTTYVNGTSALVTQTSIPTTVSQPDPSHTSPSNRTAIIAGSTVGVTAFVILLLALAFLARRKHFKYLNFLNTLTARRRQARSRATLLAGEDFDDDDVDLGGSPMPRYRDEESPSDMRRSGAPSRSENGSVFRENVWPPTSIAERTRLIDSDHLLKDNIDLSRIVDDVMGPSTTTRHFTQQSISSSLREPSMTGSEGMGETRSIGSSGSLVALIEAAGLPSNMTPGPVLNAPVHSSPLAQHGTKAESSEHGDGAS